MFWDRFYYLCKKKGTKPNPVGAEIGVSSGVITKWKNGTIPNGETLMKISEYFDVPVDFLLGVGLFSDWDKIVDHLDEIIVAVMNEIQKFEFNDSEIFAFLPSMKNNKILLIQILNTLINKIEIDDDSQTIRIHWKY